MYEVDLNVKPIETVYQGYKFRSRLEARWAVFFDELGIEWDYEPEGYNLGETGYYLPDFWLPQFEVWVEIKGKEPTEKEKEKCFRLAEGTGFPVLLFSGQIKHQPDPIDDSFGFKVPSFNLMAFFGYLWPSVKTFPFSSWVYKITFVQEMFDLPALYSFLKDKGYNPPEPIPTTEENELLLNQAKNYISLDKQYFKDKYGKEHPKWKYGFSCANLQLNKQNGKILIDMAGHPLNWEIVTAIDAAKQARFELMSDW